MQHMVEAVGSCKSRPKGISRDKVVFRENKDKDKVSGTLSRLLFHPDSGFKLSVACFIMIHMYDQCFSGHLTIQVFHFSLNITPWKPEMLIVL